MGGRKGGAQRRHRIPRTDGEAGEHGEEPPLAARHPIWCDGSLHFFLIAALFFPITDYVLRRAVPFTERTGRQ